MNKLIRFASRNILPGLILLLVGSMLTASAAFFKLPRENRTEGRRLNARIDSLAWRGADTQEAMDSVLARTQRTELRSVKTNTMVEFLYDLEMKK